MTLGRLFCPIAWFTFMTFFISPLFSQQKSPEHQKPTDKISWNSTDAMKHKTNRKKVYLIVKNNPQKILYGNPCMTEEGYKMGVEYTIQKPGLPGTLTNKGRIIHNMQSYTMLTLTKSPFWKVRLNRRVKDCRKKSGDFVG